MKDYTLFLQHILDSISRIETFTRKATKDKFLKDEMMHSAVIRQIEIIGEAVKNLPIEFIQKYPSVPWSAIAGTRDKLIHHYFGVDFDLLWDVVIKKELSPLKLQIEKIMKEIISLNKKEGK